MTKPKIYISYPFGKKITDSDYMRLKLIKDKLRKQYQPYSTIDILDEYGGVSHTETKLMKLVSVNNVYMCDGWKENDNCQIEYGVAQKMGKKIHFEEIPRNNNIVETINDIMGVDITQPVRQKKDSTFALMIVSKVLHERGITVIEIGNILHRKHTTILQFLNQYAKKIKTDSYFMNLNKTLRMYI